MVAGWLLLCSLGCASGRGSGYRMPYSDDGSQAPGAAWAGSGMVFRKDMPHRADPEPWVFYYKHCALNGNESFYSKTSYDCAGPTF